MAATLPEVRCFWALSQVGLARMCPATAVAMQLPEVNGRLRVITPAFVRAAHCRGTAVHVWTVNDIPQMCRLLHMGVDGLMSDYPDLLLRFLRKGR